jgi:hypothetical protein
MAKAIPSGLYSEGAVVFDTQPFANLYNQFIARKQAKDEALDNYFRDFGKNITPAGMRNQDIPVLTSKNNEWRQFYQQNKNAIMNPRLDGGKAYSEYMSRYQDQLQTIQQSKNAADITKEIGRVRADTKNAELISEDTFNLMALHDKPLNDPEHKTFDLNSLTFKPPAFDAKMREGVYKALTSGMTPSKIAGTPQSIGNFQLKIPYTQEFSEQDLQAIGNRAKAFADSDRSIKNYAEKELLPSVINDPIKFEELNKVYKQVYGKDAVSGQDLFAAQSILDLNRKSVEEKIEPDVFGRQKAMEAIRHANAKSLAEFKKKIDPNDTEMNNTWVESYMQQLADQARKSGKFEYKYKDGRRVYEYDIPIDPVLGKALAEGNVTPDAVRVDENGNFRRIFYQRYGKDEKEGKQEGDIKEVNGRIAVDDVISGKKLTPEQVALALGYRGQTKKQLAETMQSVLRGVQSKQETKKAKYPLPAGKPRTVKQGGFTYTWNEQTGEYE